MAIEADYLAAVVGPFSLIENGTRTPNHRALFVLGFTALFNVTLTFLYPVTAMDVYNDAIDGNVLGFDGLNPMIYPPTRASDDGFIAFAGSWADSPSPDGRPGR